MQNSTRATLRLDALKIIAARYGFKVQYIKTILWGTRTPAFSEKVKQEYIDVVAELDKLSGTSDLKSIQ